MASVNVSGRDARLVAALLALPEIRQLIADLDETRWTGRPGYAVRTMVGAALVKAVYALPTWTRTARLIGERGTAGSPRRCPSQWACTGSQPSCAHRGLLAACIDGMLAGLRAASPGMGETIAIDRSNLPAYANGTGTCQGRPAADPVADPDASWGHRSAVSTRKGGGFYGYKLHAAVCVRTGLPVAWTVRAAGESEQEMVPGLLGALASRGFAPHAAVIDKGYDGELMYQACEARGIRPVIALKMTGGVRQAGTSHLPARTANGPSPAPMPGAAHPNGAARPVPARPASVWIKASRMHPLIPRHTTR